MTNTEKAKPANEMPGTVSLKRRDGADDESGWLYDWYASGSPLATNQGKGYTRDDIKDALIAAAERRAYERAALIAQGEVVATKYRRCPSFNLEGNWHEQDSHVRLMDKIAEAIRNLAAKTGEKS